MARLSPFRAGAAVGKFGSQATPRGSIFPGAVGLGRGAPRLGLPRLSPLLPRYPGLPTNLVRGFRFTYVPNYFGIRSLARSIGVNRALNWKAGRIAETARAIAPVRTGEYRDGIMVDGNRAVATAAHSKFVEFGTSDTPIFAPLRRAADSESYGGG